MGAATFLKPPAGVRDAIKIADGLMYRAKIGGKNGIVHEIVTVARDVTSKGVERDGTTGRRIGEKGYREDL